jgi:hypothetical protein
MAINIVRAKVMAKWRTGFFSFGFSWERPLIDDLDSKDAARRCDKPTPET